MAGSTSRGTDLKIWRKLAFVCALIMFAAWGCSAALRSVDDFLSFGGEGQPVDFEFVSRHAPSPDHVSGLTSGDVILASRTDYGDTAITDLGTWAIPLSGRETGEPVQVLDENANTLSPGGSYVVAYNETTRKQEIIRLHDRTVVGEISAHGFVFLDDHRIVAFGSEDGYRFGEAKEIDLEARTIREIEAQGLTMSVSPTFVVDGEIGLCEEQELDGGSGPSCVSTRILDPASGATRPLPEDPSVNVSDSGEYLFADVWGSRQVGDSIIYWPGEEEAPDFVSMQAALYKGGTAGPDPTSDVSGVTVMERSGTIWSSSDGQWIVASGGPAGDRGVLYSVCDVATLDCSPLSFASQRRYTAPEWTMIGVLPATAIAAP